MIDESEDPTGPAGAEPVVEGAAAPLNESASSGPARRPTSLRSPLDEQSGRVPRRPLSPPPPPYELAEAPRQLPDEPAQEAVSPLDPVFERLATAQERAAVLASERPEVVVGAAFIGGLILATILKRLGRR